MLSLRRCGGRWPPRPGSTRRVYTFYSYGLMRSHLRVAQGSDMIAVHSSALRCVRRFYLKLLAHERRFFLHDDVALAAFSSHVG